MTAHKLTSRDWFGKTCAGVVLGFTLALAVSGLFAWFGPGGAGTDGGADKAQFNMWLISPLWVGVLSFVFLFRNPRRAWLWLALANLLAFGLLYGGRALLS
ncbi:hypothetical protein LJR225_001929 [Phenylobacterium sp. LjRoot225]|uniref:hypothetical protein n=1 Tax=Phenylobacterium sp. LjRoot225 TaxID=3342285 RepID=UPI003ED048E7